MARALRVRRPGGRCHVAVRGHDRKAIFRRQSALVNAKSALQRLPGPAASELLSGAAVGNHRPNWTPFRGFRFIAILLNRCQIKRFTIQPIDFKTTIRPRYSLKRHFRRPKFHHRRIG